MNIRLITLCAIIALAALYRLMPHPPNATPIAAMALFAGAYFNNRRIAILLPIATMILSDLALGFTAYEASIFKSQPVVYLCMLATVLIGRLIRNNKSIFRIALATLGSAVMFYLVTNFSVWALDTLYPKTWNGLIACYAAAIPFFRYTLIGDSAFVAITFGGFAVSEALFVSLREHQNSLPA
jgi:hypothetical protein